MEQPKFAIKELALALYNSSDHSDIRSDWSGYDYSIRIKPDGSIGGGEGSEEFAASLDFSDALWEGIDKEAFLGGWADDQEGTTYQLLDRADDQEDLSNPDYAAMVSDLYDKIADWLASIDD